MRGPSLNAQNAPAVAPVSGMNTEVGGDRGMEGNLSMSNVPRTRTQAQVPGGINMVQNGANGAERTMPTSSVVR